MQAWTKASAWCGVVLAALTIALILAPLFAPIMQLPLDTKSMNAESGYAYTIAVRLPDTLIHVFPSDRNSDVSTLVVLEDGAKLGPGHSSHDSIRIGGRGRFSHWGGYLYFSASDSSDPRVNGRTYAAVATGTVAPWITILILALDAAFLVVMRKSLLATLRRHRDGAVRALAGAAVAAALLMAAGLFGGPFYPPADAALVIAVAGHVLLAMALTVAQWIVGAGIARLMLPKRGTSYAQVMLLGFPVSLAASAILAAVALLLPLGGVLALGLAIICALPLALWPLERVFVRDLLRRLPALLLISAAFGSWLALRWHGPSSTLSGSPTGDLTFYASMTWAIAAHPQGWPNLGNEGEFFSYFNMLIPSLGAAVRSAVEIDGFLFILTMSGVTCMLGTGVAIHAYASARPQFVLWSLEGVAFLLSFVVAGRYPYWVTESPPVAHVVPLTVAVWFWVAESRRGAATPVIGLILAFVGSVTSKVASLVVLGAVALEACYRLVPRLSRPARMLLGVFGVATGVYAAMMLIRYFSFYMQISGATTESLERIFRYGATPGSVWPFLARETGCVLLVVAAFRTLPWPTSAAVAIGLVVGLVFPFLMRVNFMCAVIMLALAYVDEPERLRGSKRLVLIALLLCLPAMMLPGPGGAAMGFGWLALVSLLVFVALHRPDAVMQSAAALRPGLVMPTSLVVIALSLIALARGTMPYTEQHHSEAFSPQLRDIWAAVREQVPKDALVFTDQAGKLPTLLAGWNTFALHGQRQVFHANWYQSLKLRNTPAERDARLADNDDVLSGRRAPSDIPVSRAYSGYYAVVSIGRTMDSHWQSIYANNAHRLYRWTP